MFVFRRSASTFCLGNEEVILRCYHAARHKRRSGGVTTPWLRGLGLTGAAMMAATTFASTALADQDSASRPTPGMHVADPNGGCTAAFAAVGNDGGYYLLTSGHCDPHDGSVWTYGEDLPLGRITASE